MTRRIPDTLPGASFPGFGLTPVDQSRRTNMEVGAQRVRRLTKARLDRVKMSWVFEDAEMWVFRAWHADDLVSLIGSSDDSAAWSRTAVTRAGLSVFDPEQRLVDRLRETTDTGTHCTEVAIPGAATNNIVLAATATLKGFGRSKARLSLIDRAGSEGYAEIDLNTGVVTAQSGLSSLKVSDRGNGWWRLAATGSTGAGAATPILRVSLIDGTGSLTYTGDTTLGIGLCEMQARFSGESDLFVPCDASGYAQGASGGSAWFETDLPLGGGLSRVEARFVGPYDALAGNGLTWSVTGQMEVRNA